MPTDVQLAHETLHAQRELLAAQVLHTSAMDLARALSDATDVWLAGLWHLALQALPSPEAAQILEQGCQLLAQGGYGRRELSFHSDLDVVVMLTDEPLAHDRDLRQAVEWMMGEARQQRLKLSHAVRTWPQALEVMAQDWRTAIAALDARALGPAPAPLAREAAGRLIGEARKILARDDAGRTFVAELLEARQERLRRHGQTVYLLEPDVKNGEGSLRDLHSARWAALVRHGLDIDCPDPGPADEACPPMPQVIWSAQEDATYTEAQQWLVGLRHVLHLRHGRKHDRLAFPDQEHLAEVHLARGTPTQEKAEWTAGQDAHAERSAEQGDRASGARRPIEWLMHRHYRQARAVSALCSRALRRWAHSGMGEARDLGGGFWLGEGQVFRTAPIAQPTEVLQALELASAHQARLDGELEGALDRAISAWGPEVAEAPEIQGRFRELVASPGTWPAVSGWMLELGLMARLVPEFEPLVCHVQHDVYHVYTTDVHARECLECARALLRPEGSAQGARWPVFPALARKVRDPQLLLLACLFHDIGKNRGGGHAQKGAAMMATVGGRLGLGARAIDTLAFLVREHLTLSHTARRRDIHDRRVVRELAQSIGSLDTLNMLTVLTFCDMATVGPNVMTDWHASLLLSLHVRVAEALEGGVGQDWARVQEQLEARRAELVKTLEAGEGRDAHEGASDVGHLGLTGQRGTLLSQVDAFVRDVPAEHLLATPMDGLVRQFQVWCAPSQAPALGCTSLPASGSTELIVATGDNPGTLARICGVLAALDLNILTASIVTTHRGRTLDIFHVTPSGGSAAVLSGMEPPALLSPLRQQRLQERLLDVLCGRQEVEALVAQRQRQTRLAPRALPSMPTQVVALEGVSEAFTVLEVTTADRPGVLYRIARTLWQQGVSTHFSKIDSVGAQVVDTFYVEDVRGGPLSEARAQEVVAALERELGREADGG